MCLVNIDRFNCPIENLKNIPGGSFRLGGGRSCSQTKQEEFQLIISSDVRLLLGINVEDLYDQQYVAPWLNVLSDFYTSDTGCVDKKKKLNLARYFVAEALAVRLSAHNPALMVKPSLFFPQPNNGQQIFSEGPQS